MTLSDFNGLLGDSGWWQQALIRRCISNGAFIIAGTSYRDSDLRRWLHVALAESPAGQAAITLLAREGFRLTRAEFASVKTAVSDQWSAIGMRPVLVEDFSDAAQIVRELRHVHHAGYLAPQERASMVWHAHSERFDDLQREYSDQLSRDAAALRDALRVTSMNVTLWLPDGEGHVVRWAAQALSTISCSSTAGMTAHGFRPHARRRIRAVPGSRG